MWTPENRPRYNRDKLRYPSDLTDGEWSHIEQKIPPAKHGGRDREVDVREIVGSLTQRYVKRHGTARKDAGFRRFRQFSSPHLALRFPHGFRGGGSRRRRNTSALERGSCSENRGIGNSRISARYLSVSEDNCSSN
jgi:transposase